MLWRPSFASQGKTVNIPVLVAGPPAFVTLIGPVVAPDGTMVVIVLVERTMKVAAFSLNSTCFVPTKFEPEIVTVVPTFPLVGLKRRIVGFGLGNALSTCTTAPPPS